MTKSILIKSIILIITLCVVFSFKPKDEPKFREYIKSFDVIKSPLSVFYNCPLHPIVKNHNRYFDSLLFGINEFPISLVRDTLATVSFLVYEINSDRPYGRLNLITYDYSATLIESNRIDSEEAEDGADWAKIDTALNREHGHCPFVSYFTLLSSNVLSRSDAESSMREGFMSDGSSTIVTSVGGSDEDTFNIYPFNQKSSYYDNGQLKKKRNYVNGKKEGEWITYYENGKISLTENYLHGKKEGECIEYNELGQISFKSNYINGVIMERINYENGRKLFMVIYVNGQENGEQIDYYENGNIKWKSNNQNGEWIGYYENGKIKSKGNHLNGDWIGYYENGKIMSKCNSRNGEWIGYFENGKIKLKGYLVNGLENGEQIEYYENGKIRSEGNVVNGLEDGEWIEYYENGKIKLKSNFVIGKENGERIYYHENGQISSKCNYVDGTEVN
jgi:antitoxin component YwqK of YwqJK toxin-antitoxin module